MIKKRQWLIEIFYLILLTALFSILFFNNEIYTGHDLYFHAYRIAGSLDALLERQIPIRIYPYANNGYGYAAPLFYCDLFIIPFSILYKLGIPLLICFKLLVISFSFLSIFIVFYCSKKIFSKRYIPYLISFLYLFNPYHIYDTYSRMALGELFAMAFIPLLIYYAYLLLIKEENKSLMLGLSFALLLISHLISFIFIAFLFGLGSLIVLFKNKNKKILLINIFKAMLWGIGFSAFFLLPFLEQYFDQTLWVHEFSKIYSLNNTVQPISALFKINFQLDSLPKGNIGDYLSAGIGIELTSLIYLFLKKNKYISFLFIISIICILIAIGIIPLGSIKFLSFFQFLFRFEMYATIFLITVVAYVLENIEFKYLKLLSLPLIIINLFSFITFSQSYLISANKINDYIKRDELYDSSDINDKDYNSKELSGGEYLPITIKNDYLKETVFIKKINQDHQYEDIIYEYDRRFTYIGFYYDSKESELLMLPLTYYKGYKVYEDGKEIKVINDDIYHKVCLNTTPGNHHYECKYIGTVVQSIGLWISIVTIIIALKKH